MSLCLYIIGEEVNLIRQYEVNLIVNLMTRKPIRQITAESGVYKTENNCKSFAESPSIQFTLRAGKHRETRWERCLIIGNVYDQ